MTAAVALAAPVMALAGGGTLTGAWCNEDGDTLYLDRDGLGTSEHTICDWETAPDLAASTHESRIYCRSIYLNGDEVVELNPQWLDLTARLTPDGMLEVRYGSDGAPTLLSRCEH